MVPINYTHQLYVTNIVGFMNDIVIYDLTKYQSSEYKEWMSKQEFAKYSNLTYNTKFASSYNKHLLLAAQEIMPGEEIFIEKGFFYW